MVRTLAHANLPDPDRSFYIQNQAIANAFLDVSAHVRRDTPIVAEV